MSSSEASISVDRTGRRRRLAGTILLLAAALFTSACAESTGFRPMYGSLGTAGETDARMAQVDITTIPGRVGQRVRNELVFQNKRGDSRAETAPPGYQLDVVLRESLTSTLVQRDGEAASQIYMLDATFRLVRLTDKKIVLQGNSFGRAGFERFTSIYSNVRAREDAENRAARTIADDIKVRLAAYLSNPV
jgi:LPS-assembly lipoprotein